jgi:uroporphyrinogen-III decarboxylase
MNRQYFLDLARAGLRMPIGTHLVLHEQPDPAAIPLDGLRLGRVSEETATRFATPLAIPLMDLMLEKEALLLARGVPPADLESYHFAELPQDDSPPRLTPKMSAACDAIRYIATRPGLLPVGMCIGPFSLMTKLLQDPIAPVYMAGTGLSAREDHEIALLERALELAARTVHMYLHAQLAAGAKAILVCEPAANTAYFSPNQLATSYAAFDRYVMTPNRAIADLLRAHDAELLFHDCGELVDGMLSRFATLDPAILSLGSSRQLWRDARLLPKTTVLFGNLPSKQFYSDQLLSVAQVQTMARELTQRMRHAQHPFILASECDVLSVPGCERSINAKVDAFLKA